MDKIEAVRNALETICAANSRSAWRRGINEYARELLDELAANIQGGYISVDVLNDDDALEKAVLNGAKNWYQYSYGGSALIYDSEIAERLCSPSLLKKVRYGERQPNSTEGWLDVQARALRHAYILLTEAAYDARRT